MPQWHEQGGCPAHPVEGCLTLLTKLLQLCCSFCSPGGYSAAHSEEGEGAPAGMLEAPAPTPLLASRSPERPSQERRALLPKGSQSGRGAQSTSRALRPGADMDTQQKEMQRPERQPPLRDAKKGGKGFGSRAASAASMASEDEEFCSTCLEGYSEENPKIRTKCNHYFHLACIYEWMERKQTCPICDTPMNFEEVL